MGVTYNPRIVTDGLVLALDAGNPKSYPGSGTVWTDLSLNNNNGTLINSPTFLSSNGGCIAFDGVNDYLSIPNVNGITNFTRSDDYSINFWCYMNSVQNNTLNGYNLIAFKWNGAGNELYPYQIWYGRNSSTISVRVADGTSVRSATGSISRDTWVNVCSVFDWTNSSLKLYLNKTLSNSATLDLTGTIENNFNLSIMGNPSNFSIATGRIANFQTYNRVLTSEEIQQNFNATRSRFGI